MFEGRAALTEASSTGTLVRISPSVSHFYFFCLACILKIRFDPWHRIGTLKESMDLKDAQKNPRFTSSHFRMTENFPLPVSV